jgi:hypothetical protein
VVRDARRLSVAERFGRGRVGHGNKTGRKSKSAQVFCRSNPVTNKENSPHESRHIIG